MVIVGAGQAGARAALTLRDEGWPGPVMLIGEEAAPPYERPPLSKAVLRGEATPEAATIVDPPTLAERDVRLLAGKRVDSIDPTRKTLTLDDGRRLTYHRLLLATGARPRRLRLAGADLAGIHYLRTAEDAVALARALAPGTRLAIVGGGFIGLEVAASAISRGCTVTVIELGPRVLMRMVPQAIAEVVAARHRSAGVDLRCGETAAAFEGDGHLNAIRLASGARVHCGVAVVGIGAEPAVELAAAAGLAVEDGIMVDEALRTSHPDIFAAGDCCRFPNPLAENNHIRLEAWRNAESQGAHAARSMLGADEPYREVPWFWSDQYELTLQVAGLPGLASDTIARGVGDARLLFHLDPAGRLVGASAIGRLAEIARDVRLAQMLIERRSHPDPRALASPTTRLRSMLR